MLRQSRSHRSYALLALATVLALLVSMLPEVIPGAPAPTATAHNLQTRAISMFMDPASQALLDNRMTAPGWTPPDPLLQAGDEIGLIIKVVPRDGTSTGVGGHIDFYVPNGVTVLDTAYVVPDGSGGFVKVSMKGQSPIAIGDGPIGAKSTSQLVGLGANYTNFIGVTEAPVTAAGLHRGTIAGLYGDTGIFYATDPDTAYGSWQKYTGDWNNANVYANKCGSLAFTTANGKTLVNNSGDTIVPCNKWDAEQLMAWGVKGGSFGQSAPIVDYSDGRGNAPWGFAAGTGGPQSGYAWNFNWDEWQASTKTAADMRNAMGNDEIGPWQRIKYAGSRISKDQAGLSSTVLGYANIDGSSVGYALSPSTPLPATASQTDGASPKAIRWAVGQLTAYRPEYAWVKVRVNSVAEITDPTGCPVFHSDTFGGDAGGTDNGKDHLWRYYEPTEATWNGCLAAQKPATREIVKVGDTFQYKLKVYNFQGFTLSSVVVRDTLPGGVTFVSAAPAQTSGPNPLVWNVGALLPGQKWEATVTVTARGTGFLDNCMDISSGQLPTQTVCDSTTSGGYPYLVPSKTASSSTVTPGGTVNYTLLVKNVGTAASASPVVLNEYLPPGFTYQSLVGQVKVNGASVPQTTVNATNPNQPTFTVPAAIQAGKDLLLTFTAKAPANITPGTYCNMYRVVDNGIPITTGSEACVTAGDQGAGKIGDTIFRDWNGNGAQDAGEEGMPGVTVTLTRPDASTVTAVTDANGQYLFASLAPGSYTVSVPALGSGGVPAGWALTADPDGSPYNLSYAKNLATDEVYLGADFGYQPRGTGSIGDQVFDDKDLSATFNAGDAGIPNITVRLYEDGNGNGVIDAGDALVATTATSAGGAYSFNNLATGYKYLVDVDQADPDLSTYFGGGVFTATTVDPHNVGTLAGAYTAADFGFHKDVPPGTFSVGDQVFIDANNNGAYEAGTDTPLPNVGLTLYQDTNNNGSLDGGDVAIGTAVTSITGAYTFANLPAGKYIVDVNQADADIPAGYALRGGTSDPWAVTLGPSRTDVDFPFVAVPPPPSPISKTVDKANANVGDVLNYSLTTHYTGSSLLTNVVVTDTVPTGTTYVADSDTPEATVTPADNATANLLTWSLGSNAAGVSGHATGGGGTTVLTATQDASVTSARPDNNFGGQTQLGVNSVYHSLIQFDLSSIPAGAPIAYAELVLNRTGGTTTPTGSIEVRALTQSWQEGTQNDVACTDGVTWNNRDCNPVAAWTTAGGTINATVYATSAVVTGVNTWDVTSLAQAWVNGTLTNNGLMLQMASGADSHNFSSKEGATPPQLKLYYGPKTGMAVWRSASVTTPKYDLWDGAAFGTAANSATMGVWRGIQAAAAPTRNEKIAVGVSGAGGSGAINAEVWNGSTWTAASINQLNTTLLPETYWYGFDVAYEQISGDAVMVWDNNAASNMLQYSVWNGTSWSAKTTISAYTGGEPQQMHLAAKPDGDEMVLVVSDINADHYALVWNGSSWGNAVTLDTSGTGEVSQRALHVAYESQTGRAMVIYGKLNDTKAYYRIWNGTSWSTESSITAPGGLTAQASLFEVASDPGSNRIVLGVMDHGTGSAGSYTVWLTVWDGSSWAAATNVYSSANSDQIPNVAVAFEGQSGQALATWGTTGTTVQYRTWSSGGDWSATSSLTIGGAPYAMTLDASPFSNRVMLTVQNSLQDTQYALWNGSSWGTVGTHDANSVELFTQPFAFTWDAYYITPYDMAVWHHYPATSATKHNPWDGSAFTTSSNTAGTVSITQGLQGAAAPTRNEKIFLGIDAFGAIKGEVWNGGAWTSIPGTSLGSPGFGYPWAYSVAYEQTSGDALIAFADASNTLKYATWNGSSWTNATAVSDYPTLAGANPAKRVALASKPGSNEIAMAVTDNLGKTMAWIWNGSSWGSGVLLHNPASAPNTASAIAYESLSGNIMVTYSKGFGQTNVFYRIWNGSTWSAEASTAPPGTITTNFNFSRLASDPNSDRIVLGVTTASGTAMTWMSVWDGNAWGTAVMGSATAGSINYPSVDVAFEGTSSEALAVFNDASLPNIYYKFWKPATGWLAVPGLGLNIGARANIITANPDPNSDNIMVVAQNINDDLTYTLWPGNAPFGSGTVLEIDTGAGGASAVSMPALFLWHQHQIAPAGPSLGNVMAAAPTLVTAGSTITVTMALTATQSIASVSPGALVITGTNGVNATLLTGPTPASATIGASPTTFTWTYQATAGATIGQLTFGGNATDGSNTWPNAKTNSVIVHPPLTFQVTVNNPATVNPVTNKGYIKDASVIPLSPSNTVQTTIGASIGDRVWADLDGQSDQDVGEPGIGGVQVCATPVGGGAAVCATTDSQGVYHIYGLTNGVQYTVMMTPGTIPANYLPTTATTLTRTASVSTPVTDADFGLRPPGQATIGDTVWIDANEDGVVDSGETRLPGITVKLYDSAGTNLLATTTTTASGIYTFTGLYAGNYKVQVDTTSTVTSPYDGATTLAAAMDLVSVAGSPTPPLNNPLTVNVPTNTSAITTADFGFNWGGSIGDYVWWDNNINRLQDESTPIANAIVLLYFDANTNGTLDQLNGDIQVGFAMTNISGLYLFDNLPPGRYLVDVYEDSITTNGIRNIVPTTADVVFKNLGPNEDYLAADFGYYVGAKVEGNVFWDEDHNGVLDGVEQDAAHLLNNVTVNIVCLGADGVAGGGDDYTGSMDAGTQGLPNGHFAFIVPPGPCTLTYDQPDIPAQYTDRTTPTSYAFTAVGGEDWHPSFDFGVDHGGKLGDTVWNDVSGNGMQDGGEPGFANVTLDLYLDADGNPATTNDQTYLGNDVTDAFGKYEFVGLPDTTGSQQYVVKVVTSTLTFHYEQTGDPDDATPPCTGGECDNQGLATLTAANSHLDNTIDFGYQYKPGGVVGATFTIAGFVWQDTSGEGTKNPGEPVIPGATVTVDCGVDGMFTTVSTANTFLSNWSVVGIPQGATCTIDVNESTLPSPAYVATTPATRTVTNIQNDVTGQNFGYKQWLGSISGTACSGNLTGDCVGGEPVLSGVTVTLRYAGSDGILGTIDDVVSTQQTDVNGNYNFPTLTPGLYQVVETNPLYYSSLSDADSPNGFGNPDNITLTLDFGLDGIPGNADDRLVRINQDFEDAPPVDLSLTKSDRFDPAVPGSSLTYTITIANAGPGLANNVVVTDTLPAQVTFASATPGYTGPNPLVWNAGSLNVNATRTFTIAVTTNLGFTGVITNTATVRTTSSEPNLSNNSDQEPTTIATPASLGDFIYFDANGNGTQQVGETSGINGVTVTAVNQVTGQTYTTTSVNGAYLLSNLPPGTYSVSVPPSAPGMVRTSASPVIVTLLPGQNRSDVDFGYISPTGMTLASFTAQADAGGVLLRWTTMFEDDIDGFVVWRSSQAAGDYTAISDLIPSQDPTGASYEWLDASAESGQSYWYKLQSQPDGQFFGPIASQSESGQQKLFAPLILRHR